MKKNLAQHLTDPRQTSPSEAIPGREREMQRGPAGGFVFKTGDWERLDRFLIIGTEGGTYYAGERKLTRDAADVVRRCLEEDALRVIDRICSVSVGALAPKNDQAILALAIAFASPAAFEGNGDSRADRAKALRMVCRTGTHLFQFLETVTTLRGGGRSLNSAVRSWIQEMPIDRLALQMVKYRNRAGWTWRDVIRRFRPKPPELGHIEESRDLVGRSHLYAWAVGKECAERWLPKVIEHYEVASSPGNLPGLDLPHYISLTKLPWECVPSDRTTEPAVLEALFESMPMMATVRQLSKLQAYGVIEKRRSDVIARLTDERQIRKSRIHPVALLVAASAYEKGAGRHLTWTPDGRIVDALDDAFQAALRVAEPTGRKTLVAIDSSGSMHQQFGQNDIQLFRIAAAMALTHVRTDDAHCITFDCEGMHRSVHHPESPARGFSELALSPRQRVVDAMRMIEEVGMGGGTDCSIPFRYAAWKGIHVDTFVVFTDNESWHGPTHPAQALQRYREKVNPKAKAVWCAMAAGESSLADPKDPRVLSIAGFDASAPQLIADFAADRF